MVVNTSMDYISFRGDTEIDIHERIDSEYYIEYYDWGLSDIWVKNNAKAAQLLVKFLQEQLEEVDHVD